MAEYIVKRFDRNDISITNEIKLWWGRKVGAILADTVFTDYGYLITDDAGNYLVASFLYPIMGCEAALMGFPVANPTIGKEVRQQALHILTTVIENDAKRLKYRILISYAGSKGAEALFTREGYRVYDTNVINFGKVL